MILIAGFLGTTVMTLFSYLYSKIRSRQFREPELLNVLINNTHILQSEVSKKNAAGWVLHYLIGWIIVICFQAVWQFTSLPINFSSGLLLGFSAGILSVISWSIMFFLNPNPLNNKFNEYYIHLVFAHIIFGITVAAVYIYF